MGGEGLTTMAEGRQPLHQKGLFLAGLGSWWRAETTAAVELLGSEDAKLLVLKASFLATPFPPAQFDLGRSFSDGRGKAAAELLL